VVRIFEAGGGSVLVRVIMIVSLLTAAGCFWGGWVLFQTYGLSPGDGGVLAPVGERLAWGLVVAALGLLFALGMWAFGRIYVHSIDLDEGTDTLRIRTMSFFGLREAVYPTSDVIGSTYVAGNSSRDTASVLDIVAPGDAHYSGVNAPYYWLRLRSRRGSLVVDAKGDFAPAARQFLKTK
jgi:hypothetical protein